MQTDKCVRVSRKTNKPVPSADDPPAPADITGDANASTDAYQVRSVTLSQALLTGVGPRRHTGKKQELSASLERNVLEEHQTEQTEQHQTAEEDPQDVDQNVASTLALPEPIRL